MADETYEPKPRPGARMVPWPAYIASRAWAWLSWPWQVRQMKAAGFRRVGWMTWEYDGLRSSQEARRHG